MLQKNFILKNGAFVSVIETFWFLVPNSDRKLCEQTHSALYTALMN